MKHRPSFLSVIAATLGLGGLMQRVKVGPAPTPQTPYTPPDHAPKTRFGSDTPPRVRKPKHRRTLHAIKARRYGVFCHGSNAWGVPNTGLHRHGRQRMREAFAKGEGYMATSRRAGQMMLVQAIA